MRRLAFQPDGMTLLETLLVVVLLGAATTVSLGFMGRDGSGERAARATLQTTLDRAHLIARSRGGATLIGGQVLIITPDRLEQGGASRVALPSGWSLVLLSGGEPLESIRFDVEGFAADVTLVLESEAGPPILFEYLGVSGELHELMEGEPR